MDTIDEQYLELLKLEPNWDSYGAPKIDPKCVSKMMAIHMEVMEHGPFTVVPGSDGGVQIESHANGYDIEISVSPAPTGSGGEE